MCHVSFVTRRKRPAAPRGPNPRSSYSPNEPKTLLSWFFKVVVLPNLVDSHLDFLSSLHCTPPLPSALPALTGQPANRPITAQQKSVSTNRSLCSRSGCMEHTVVLGSGCIPSKADLFEHHPITWPQPYAQGVSQVTLKPSHLARERKERAGLMTQGFVVRGLQPYTDQPHGLLSHMCY